MNSRVGSFPRTYSLPSGGYVRDAFFRGMVLEWEDRGNPYKFGLIGSSDTHTGASSYDESNFWSKIGIIDATPMGRGSIPVDDYNQTILGRQSNFGDTGLPIEIYEGQEGNYLESGFTQWAHPVWLPFGLKKTLENQFLVPYAEKKLLLPVGTGFQFVSLVAIV